MFNYFVVVVLIAFSALFSGLTLGLMGLSPAELKRKMLLGNKDAAKVYTVRRKGNLLLTTLLIGNVAVNATLSIFLGSITSGVVGGFMATGLIVIFGEITPQAAFSRFALLLGAKTAWLVRIFIFVLYPISFPIAWALNKTFGDELPIIYSKQELMKIIEEHEDAEASDIDEDEERIVKGALTFSSKQVRDVMTPRSVVEMLEASCMVDESLLRILRRAAHTRIPVYKKDRDNIVGILYLKQLLGKTNMGKTVGHVSDKKVFFVDEDKRLDAAFAAFLRTRHHLFIVKNKFGSVEGIITLEDILEEIIKTEIMDEGDKHQDLRKLARMKKRRGKGEV